MNNKNVGWLIVGISIFIFIIIGIFNFGIKDIIGATCSHGDTCGMYDSVKIQTWISLAIAFVVLVIGLFLAFSKKEIKIITKKQPKKKLNLQGLDKKEFELVRLVEKENGAMFQSTLMETLGIGKVGMTRMLDKLEAKQIIERKRRGMNNIVVLKR